MNYDKDKQLLFPNEWKGCHLYSLASKFQLPRVVVLLISTTAWRPPMVMGEAWKSKLS